MTSNTQTIFSYIYIYIFAAKREEVFSLSFVYMAMAMLLLLLFWLYISSDGYDRLLFRSGAPACLVPRANLSITFAFRDLDVAQTNRKPLIKQLPLTAVSY